MKCSDCGEEMKLRVSAHPKSWRCPNTHSFNEKPNDGYCPECAKDAKNKKPVPVEESGGICREWTCPNDHSVTANTLTVAESIELHEKATRELERLTSGEIQFTGPADTVRAIMAELEARIRRERPEYFGKK